MVHIIGSMSSLFYEAIKQNKTAPDVYIRDKCATSILMPYFDSTQYSLLSNLHGMKDKKGKFITPYQSMNSKTLIKMCIEWRQGILDAKMSGRFFRRIHKSAPKGDIEEAKRFLMRFGLAMKPYLSNSSVLELEDMDIYTMNYNDAVAGMSKVVIDIQNSLGNLRKSLSSPVNSYYKMSSLESSLKSAEVFGKHTVINSALMVNNSRLTSDDIDTLVKILEKVDMPKNPKKDQWGDVIENEFEEDDNEY